MERKQVTRRSRGKEKNGEGADVQRKTISAGAEAVPVARDPAIAARRLDARLKSVAKETFRNMGED